MYCYYCFSPSRNYWIYIYASIHDLDWAKVISALIEVSAIITLIVSWIKKVKPKEVEYQIDEERCKTES